MSQTPEKVLSFWTLRCIIACAAPAGPGMSYSEEEEEGFDGELEDREGWEREERWCRFQGGGETEHLSRPWLPRKRLRGYRRRRRDREHKRLCKS